jgi:PAS domain S-box-containing protein
MPNTWSDFARRTRNGTHDPALRQQLDGLAAIAAQVCGTPVALISLASDSVQVYIGRSGLDTDHVAHRGSFCACVMHAAVPDTPCAVIVPDASADPRFADHPLVTGAPHFRFLAGVPLLNSNGVAVGALAVIDTAPRDALPQVDHLHVLARAAMASLERWRVAQVEHGRQAMPPSEARDMTRRFETLADALPQLVWSAPSDGQSDYFSQQWCDFTGAPASASYGAGWVDFVHPEDIAVARTSWRKAVESGGPYTVEYRLRQADGSYRWMLARGLPITDEFGRTTRWIGTCTDIDERVRTGDMMEFMARELSHRVKNLFSVVQGLIALALRRHPQMSEVSLSLQSRMVALGHAHDLIRPRVAEGAILRSQTTLRQLIRILTQAYVEDDASRLELLGDDAVLDEQAATPLTLFFHEMAINSARFGALSVPQGQLQIRIAVDDHITVEWTERAGPAVPGIPEPGFGLALTRLTVERQLGGTLAMTWAPDGLQAVARIPVR